MSHRLSLLLLIASFFLAAPSYSKVLDQGHFFTQYSLEKFLPLNPVVILNVDEVDCRASIEAKMCLVVV